MGKRGVIAESLNNACWFWVRADAAEWADVLGGEVRLYEEPAIGDALPKPEEPF